jgi:hypothetical protein
MMALAEPPRVPLLKTAVSRMSIRVAQLYLQQSAVAVQITSIPEERLSALRLRSAVEKPLVPVE